MSCRRGTTPRSCQGRQRMPQGKPIRTTSSGEKPRWSRSCRTSGSATTRTTASASASFLSPAMPVPARRRSCGEPEFTVRMWVHVSGSFRLTGGGVHCGCGRVHRGGPEEGGWRQEGAQPPPAGSGASAAGGIGNGRCARRGT
ncbi:hypothetical protein PVAP13_1NG199319 [Panicum virgatum]|uniref:Uncharacterized protein n=1 Tax=Panicum virgatum TaxID=38727 RepID=A0A8T0WTP9_PANVG|nr:hypothetical protein PVAP13_1NG199319 [Panicum virgatum]